MLKLLAWAMSNEMFILAVTQIGIFVGGMAKIWWDVRKREEDRKDREQDRLDRTQLAALTLDQLEQVKANGSERLKTLVKEVIKTRQVNIHAIKAANSFNEKLEKVKEKIDEKPIDVHIISNATDPVSVKEVEEK